MKLLPFLVIAILYILARVSVFNLDQDRIFPDTSSYALVAEESLTSKAFWARERPFTVPLVYKALGVTGEVYTLHASDFSRVTRLQLILSILSWIFLGSVLSRLMIHKFTKILAFLITLTFSISIDISQWDRILISESLSTSFFVLFVGLSFLLLRRTETDQGDPERRNRLLILAFLLVAGLYSFSRDTNAYFLLQIVVYLSIISLLMGIKKRRLHRGVLLVVLGLTAIVLTQLTSAAVGKRWFGPFANVFYARLRQPEQGLNWFIAQGLPIDEVTEKRLLGFTREEFKLWIEGEQAKDFKAWVLENGQVVYLGYLLHHPLRSLGKPILAGPNMLNPDSSEYRRTKTETPAWVSLLSGLFFPHDPIVLNALVLSAATGVVSLAFRRGRLSGWLIPTLLWITLYPLMLIIYHGDAIELERHSYQLALQLRMGAWFGLVFLLDQGYLHSRSRQTHDGLTRFEP